MAVEPADLPENCPSCGKPLAEWTENDGSGVIAGGVTYCSEDCAVREHGRG